ncbi:MAG: flagellar biosynthetic protein FliR [Phycisphaerae bacterium]|nr:flagellar biosynthetic protein FliR [Phycisphaerae bacterium]
MQLLLPFMLLLGRVAAFFSVLPIFGWRALPMRVRAGIALLVTIFFAMLLPPAPETLGDVHWAAAALLLIREILVGLALGLAARLVFTAAQQAGRIIGRQMGFALANIIDPVSGAGAQPVGLLFEVTFALFFLTAGGHHLLLLALSKSYEAFPVARTPQIGALTEAVLAAGSAMLLFALKLAAPLLAAFLILAVVLAILARVLPEMNILLTALPLRVAVGLFMAAALMPALHGFARELADWLSRNLITA